jgi:hypothetical protein
LQTKIVLALEGSQMLYLQRSATGVGTSSFKPVAILGGAFGYGLKRNVLNLCKFLCRNSEIGFLLLAERSASGGLLRISRRSLGSDFPYSQREIDDSLPQMFEKLPFLGD